MRTLSLCGPASAHVHVCVLWTHRPHRLVRAHFENVSGIHEDRSNPNIVTLPFRSAGPGQKGSLVAIANRNWSFDRLMVNTGTESTDINPLKVGFQWWKLHPVPLRTFVNSHVVLLLRKQNPVLSTCYTCCTVDNKATLNLNLEMSQLQTPKLLKKTHLCHMD